MPENNFIQTEKGVSLKNDICLIFPYVISDGAIVSVGIDKDISSIPRIEITEEDDSVFGKTKAEFHKMFGYKLENKSWIYLGEFKIPLEFEGNIYSYAVDITDQKSKKPEKNTKTLLMEKVSSAIQEGDLFINGTYLSLLKELH